MDSGRVRKGIVVGIGRVREKSSSVFGKVDRGRGGGLGHYVCVFV